MKFQIGEHVKIKGTDKVGIIKSYKIDGYTLYDKEQVITKYCVQIGASYHNDWYLEEKLEKHITYDVDPNFEIGLIDLLIDIYLLNKNNLDTVKKLYKEKLLYEVE